MSPLEGFPAEPYVDDFFEEACLVAKSLSYDQVLVLKNSFDTIYTQIEASFQSEYLNFESMLHKGQSFTRFYADAYTGNFEILSEVETYISDVQDVADAIDALTNQYRNITGQTLNFYDLMNTVDFSSLTDEMSKKLTFISDIAKTTSNESKKGAVTMTAVKNENESLYNIFSVLDVPKKRILASMREFKNRLKEVDLYKSIMLSTLYILEKTASGTVTISDLSKMTSGEREVFLNE